MPTTHLVNLAADLEYLRISCADRPLDFIVTISQPAALLPRQWQRTAQGWVYLGTVNK